MKKMILLICGIITILLGSAVIYWSVSDENEDATVNVMSENDTRSEEGKYREYLEEKFEEDFMSMEEIESASAKITYNQEPENQSIELTLKTTRVVTEDEIAYYKEVLATQFDVFTIVLNGEEIALGKNELVEYLEMKEVSADFNYNHMYNTMICCHGSDTYICRYNGIYYRESGKEEELLFENPCAGIVSYNDYIFFCGAIEDDVKFATTIYRLDTKTKEVMDALPMIDHANKVLYWISIYDNKIYVTEEDMSMGSIDKICYELNENGEILDCLEEDIEDILYTDNTSGFYEMYTDSLYAKKFLKDNQVVRAPSELESLYIKKGKEDYEFLCDTYDPILTEHGIYYIDFGKIYFVDYETTKEKEIYQSDDFTEIHLANYDEEYVYFTETYVTINEGEPPTYEQYLKRISRITGDVEEVHKFVDFYEMTLFKNCGVDSNYMYFDDYEAVNLK